MNGEKMVFVWLCGYMILVVFGSYRIFDVLGFEIVEF